MFLIPHNLKLHELFNKKHKIIWSLKIGTTISVFILHSLVVLPIPSEYTKFTKVHNTKIGYDIVSSYILG